MRPKTLIRINNNKINKTITLVTVFLVAFLFLVGCQPKTYSSTSFLMDTVIIAEITGNNAQEVYNEANKALLEFDNRISMYTSGSDIDRINMAAGKEFVQVEPATYDLLKKGVDYCELSEGKFDITIGPISKAWDIKSENPKVPNITPQMLEMVNFRDIKFNEEDKSVMLSRPGQMIDLGGLAKGAAGDELFSLFGSMKPKSALFSLGGDIVGFGKSFRIGIQNPRGADNDYFSIVEINSGQKIATSGDYQRYFEVDGVRYHHILDPKTGFPVESDFVSMTVINEDGIEADYLSTLLFMKSREEIMQLRNDSSYTFIAVDKDKNVFISNHLKDKFTLKNDGFVLK